MSKSPKQACSQGAHEQSSLTKKTWAPLQTVTYMKPIQILFQVSFSQNDHYTTSSGKKITFPILLFFFPPRKTSIFFFFPTWDLLMPFFEMTCYKDRQDRVEGTRTA